MLNLSTSIHKKIRGPFYAWQPTQLTNESIQLNIPYQTLNVDTERVIPFEFSGSEQSLHCVFFALHCLFEQKYNWKHPLRFHSVLTKSGISMIKNKYKNLIQI